MFKKFPMTGRKRDRSRRRAATMVEMAFVVAILLTLTLGLIQWGLIMNTSIAVTNLSREGARFAAVKWQEPDSDEQITRYVEADASSNGINPTHITIAISPPKSGVRIPGQPITVSVTYDMSKRLFLPAKFFSATFFNGTYKAEGRMMME